MAYDREESYFHRSSHAAQRQVQRQHCKHQDCSCTPCCITQTSLVLEHGGKISPSWLLQAQVGRPIFASTRRRTWRRGTSTESCNSTYSWRRFFDSSRSLYQRHSVPGTIWAGKSRGFDFSGIRRSGWISLSSRLFVGGACYCYCITMPSPSPGAR